MVPSLSDIRRGLVFSSDSDERDPDLEDDVEDEEVLFDIGVEADFPVPVPCRWLFSPFGAHLLTPPVGLGSRATRG